MPEEAAALGHVSEGRLHEYALSRTCARRALSALGFPTSPILSGSKREPLWPAGIVGSITHCKGYCAAAVARKVDFATVGIDAEIHAELPEGVINTVALPEELEQIRALRTPARAIHWDRILFSAKESIYKAWYPIEKKWLGFKDVLLTLHPETQEFQARFLVPAPIVGGRSIASLYGRHAIENGIVLTIVTLAALTTQAVPAA
ncbi:MAG: 4'-phosphopantetheinyl transferase family protein [Candidatus Acidiferrales bacterium]